MGQPDVMDLQSDSGAWWEPVQRDGCLMWRAWLHGVSAEHPLLRMALEMVRQKVERGQS